MAHSIRPATEADLPAMLAIYTPYVTQTAFSFEYAPPTAEEFAARFAAHTEQFPWLVCEEGGRILGYAYAGVAWERAAYRWCAEGSVYISQEHHRKGVGSALYDALEAILTRQGYRTLYAVITADNLPSIAFHEARGYVRCALFSDCGFKHGAWRSVAWLEKRLLPNGTPDSFPKRWRELC